MKDFVLYQEALALRELGFDEPCFGRIKKTNTMTHIRKYWLGYLSGLVILIVAILDKEYPFETRAKTCILIADVLIKAINEPQP